jgi:hypothetical protein
MEKCSQCVLEAREFLMRLKRLKDGLYVPPEVEDRIADVESELKAMLDKGCITQDTQRLATTELTAMRHALKTDLKVAEDLWDFLFGLWVPVILTNIYEVCKKEEEKRE